MITFGRFNDAASDATAAVSKANAAALKSRSSIAAPVVAQQLYAQTAVQAAVDAAGKVAAAQQAAVQAYIDQQNAAGAGGGGPIPLPNGADNSIPTGTMPMPMAITMPSTGIDMSTIWMGAEVLAAFAIGWMGYKRKGTTTGAVVGAATLGVLELGRRYYFDEAPFAPTMAAMAPAYSVPQSPEASTWNY